MNAVPFAALAAPTFSATPGNACPLNHGLAVLDQLLAAITRDTACDDFEIALDAALDLRLLLADDRDADAILTGFFRLRRIVEERHYLACFRLRRWLEAHFSARVFLDRCAPPRVVALSLDVADCAELRNRCALAACDARSAALWARIQFVKVAASVALA